MKLLLIFENEVLIVLVLFIDFGYFISHQFESNSLLSKVLLNLIIKHGDPIKLFLNSSFLGYNDHAFKFQLFDFSFFLFSFCVKLLNLISISLRADDHVIYFFLSLLQIILILSKSVSLNY